MVLGVLVEIWPKRTPDNQFLWELALKTRDDAIALNILLPSTRDQVEYVKITTAVHLQGVLGC